LTKTHALNYERQDKIIKLETYVDFVGFLKKAKELEGNYSEIIKPISADYVHGIPQIKVPGTEWFSVMNVDKEIISIGSTLVKARDPEKSLNIISFFKKTPEVILLYTDDIPFELIIGSDKLMAIVSMVSSGAMRDRPGIVIHRMKKISAPKETIFDILHSFRLVGGSADSKMFFIEEINAQFNDYKDIIIFGTLTESTICYFKDGDILRTIEFKEGEKQSSRMAEASKSEVMDYERRMNMVRQYLTEKSEKLEKEITPEQIKKIENVLIKQPGRQKYKETK
jgi:hypothetical protein